MQSLCSGNMDAQYALVVARVLGTYCDIVHCETICENSEFQTGGCSCAVTARWICGQEERWTKRLHSSRSWLGLRLEIPFVDRVVF